VGLGSDRAAAKGGMALGALSVSPCSCGDRGCEPLGYASLFSKPIRDDVHLMIA